MSQNACVIYDEKRDLVLCKDYLWRDARSTPWGTESWNIKVYNSIGWAKRFIDKNIRGDQYNDMVIMGTSYFQKAVRDLGVCPVRRNIAAVRPLWEIASDIRRTWPKPYFGAVPYLDAMSSLESIDDKYMFDTADSIVRYFLANAATWKGEAAKQIKQELKSLLKRPTRRNPEYRTGRIDRLAWGDGYQAVTIDGVKYMTWFDLRDLPGIKKGAIVKYVPKYGHVDHYGDIWTAEIISVRKKSGDVLHY